MEGPSCDIHDDASPRSESEISFVSAESGNRCIGFRHSNYLHKTTSDTLSLSAKGPNQVAHPNFRTLSSTLSPPAADPKATTGSYFAHQPTASGIEPRTPQNKRPPASRSSHGVGTSSGPPPSLSTRHSYTADSSWRHPPSDDPSPLHRPLALCLKPNHSVDSVVETAQRSGATTIGSDTLLTLAPGLPAESIMDAEEARNNKGSATEDDQDPTLRVNVQSREEGKHTRHKDGQQQTQTLHEDLFFDLARADSVADDAPEPLTRSERRLVSGHILCIPLISCLLKLV